MSLRLIPRLRTVHRVLFNVGTVAIAVYVAAQLYFTLAGLDRHRPVYGSIESFVWPLYVFAGGVFALNSWLVAVALSIERGVRAFSIWRNQFLWLGATYFASASIAAILVAFTNTLNWALVGLLLPLIAASFVAVRTTLGRLEDANQHLAEVNQLYLSTIETLAMAVDAKDQVTHGHIRRVQRFAVELAKELGVSDDQQLKAIEAAALLHDMGKLAIPEFILNKPGKLTASEFEVMKTHAALGADILSSIRFPYPVVPIVRHHHENWDGTGYPDGLSGSAIPIGARILSVVDCYDALTSDRPYRSALSDAEAIEILSQRRGRMYDPLVVDAFVSSLATLQHAARVSTSAPVLVAQRPVGPKASANAVASPSIAMGSLQLLTELAPIPIGATVQAVSRQALRGTRQIANFEVGILFVCDPAKLELQAMAVEGLSPSEVSSLRIPFSERLSGWVASYRKSVWNSDASLDLGDISVAHRLTFASSVPLVVGDTAVGALTLYGRPGYELSIAQRQAIELSGPLIGEAIKDSLARGPQSIDGRRGDVREAAVRALDALLSHSDDAAVAVVALSPQAADELAESDMLSATLHLASKVLSGDPGCQCVVLDSHCCVIAAVGDGAEARLSRSLVVAKTSAELAAFRVAAITVRDSLHLHVCIQNTARASSRQGSTQAPRIH